jgi:hypothetical protein
MGHAPDRVEQALTTVLLFFSPLAALIPFFLGANYCLWRRATFTADELCLGKPERGTRVALRNIVEVQIRERGTSLMLWGDRGITTRLEPPEYIFGGHIKSRLLPRLNWLTGRYHFLVPDIFDRALADIAIEVAQRAAQQAGRPVPVIRFERGERIRVPMPDTAPPAADRSDDAHPDPVCVRCRYYLRKIPLDSVCPECGLPIASSLASQALQYADPKWLRSLQRGAGVLCIAAMGSLLCEVASFHTAYSRFSGTGGFGWLAFGAKVLFVATNLLFIIGIFVFTRPEPGHEGTSPDATSRYWTRMLSVAPLAAGILYALQAVPASTLGQLYALSVLLPGTVCLWYCRRLFRRLGSERLHDFAFIVASIFSLITLVHMIVSVAWHAPHMSISPNIGSAGAGPLPRTPAEVAEFRVLTIEVAIAATGLLLVVNMVFAALWLEVRRLRLDMQRTEGRA